jgi:rubrerythrin
LALYIFWRNVLAKRTFSNYEAKVKSWGRSWVCLKCGHTFEEPAEQ